MLSMIHSHGASGNYISKIILSPLHSSKIIPRPSTEITFGDGPTTEVNESIRLNFTISSLQSTVHTATFDIIKSFKPNMFLEMCF